MKANELRIGNWVEFTDHLIKQQQVVYVDLNAKMENIKPIPLTEGTLIRSGFEAIMYHDERTYLTPESWLPIRYRIRIRDSVLVWMPDMWTCVKLPHVHSLQNLLFTLTSEELEIKI